MSLSHLSLFPSLEKKRDTPPATYEDFIKKGYKLVDIGLDMRNYRQNNIISVTAIAALSSRVNAEDFEGFNQLFINLFGEENKIHVLSVWHYFQRNRNPYSIGVFPTLIETWDQSLQRPAALQLAQFEAKLDLGRYPNLCSDEVYLFDQICHRLQLKLTIFISQNQRIIIGEHNKTEIVLFRVHSNCYYFPTSPQAAHRFHTVEFNQPDLDKYASRFELPKTIQHSETTKNQNRQSIEKLSSAIIREIFSFLASFSAKGHYYHNAVIDRNLIAFSQANKRLLEIAHHFHRDARGNTLSRFYKDSFPVNVFLDIPLALHTLLMQNHQRAYLCFLLTNYNESELAVKLFPPELPISAQDILDLGNIIRWRLIKRHATTLARAVIEKLPAIQLLQLQEMKKESKENEDKNEDRPIVLRFIHAFMKRDLPILEPVQRLFLELEQSGIPLSTLRNCKNSTSPIDPWIYSVLYSATDIGEIGKDGINILLLALRNGLDQSFFTSQDPEIIALGLKSLFMLTLLPLRILKLFKKLYPDFFNQQLNELSMDKTILECAVDSFKLKNISFLIEHKADLSKEDGSHSFFHHLISHNADTREKQFRPKPYERRRQLIRKLASDYPQLLTCKNNSGQSPFLWAAAHLFYDDLPLLEHKESAQDKDPEGRTALHLVFINQYIHWIQNLAPTIETLLQMGHNINALDNHNNTPVYYAFQLAIKVCEYSSETPVESADFDFMHKLFSHPDFNIETRCNNGAQKTPLEIIAKMPGDYPQRFLLALLKHGKSLPNGVVMEKVVLCHQAIYNASDKLKENDFKEAEKFLARARKYDGELLDSYIVQVFDRFKTCYSFTPEQYAFLLHSPAVLATEQPSQLMFLGHQLAFNQLADRDPQAAGDLFKRALHAGKAYANRQESSHEDVDQVDQQDLSLESKSSPPGLDAEEKADDRQLALSSDDDSSESLELGLGSLFPDDEKSRPLPQTSALATPPPEVKVQRSRWLSFWASLTERNISDDRLNERQFRVTSKF